MRKRLLMLGIYSLAFHSVFLLLLTFLSSGRSKYDMFYWLLLTPPISNSRYVLFIGGFALLFIVNVCFLFFVRKLNVVFSIISATTVSVIISTISTLIKYESAGGF